MHNQLEAEAGIAIDESTGKIVKNMPFHMATPMIYKAHANDRITVNDWAFLLNLAIYKKEVPEEYMYTYMYEDEQNWSCYDGKFSEEGQ